MICRFMCAKILILLAEFLKFSLPVYGVVIKHSFSIAIPTFTLYLYFSEIMAYLDYTNIHIFFSYRIMKKSYV